MEQNQLDNMARQLATSLVLAKSRRIFLAPTLWYFALRLAIQSGAFAGTPLAHASYDTFTTVIEHMISGKYIVINEARKDKGYEIHVTTSAYLKWCFCRLTGTSIEQATQWGTTLVSRMRDFDLLIEPSIRPLKK